MLTLHVYAPPLPVDQPSGRGDLRVVIVGGGLTGVATAIHLMRRGGSALRVTIVEPSESLGRGVAYGTRDPDHLLNVPAARMALDPADPGAFLRFARSRGVAASEASLLPRQLFGDYVSAALVEAIAESSARLRVVRARASRIARATDAGGAGWEVQLSNGRTLSAEHLVLATGHGPAAVPEVLRQTHDGRAVPLSFGATRPGDLDTVAASDRLLVVGTGLTALDVLATLRRRRHTGPIEIVSLTGRWPGKHLGSVVWTGAPWRIDPEALPGEADLVAAWLEREVAAARAASVPWQAVVDALRPHIPGLWARLPETERSRFLTVHRPAWERLRHRAPSAMIDLARQLEAEGWCRRRMGHIACLFPSEDGWDVTLTLEEGSSVVRVDRVIVCTGPGSDPSAFGGPWPALRADGLVRDDPLGLGVPTDARGQVLGVDGPSEGLWAAGGLLRTRHFEATAVPEIVQRARSLACELVGAAD